MDTVENSADVGCPILCHQMIRSLWLPTSPNLSYFDFYLRRNLMVNFTEIIPTDSKNKLSTKYDYNRFLLSSGIKSEGSIAIIKKFYFDFFMVFDSTSLPQSKNVFQKKCVCVCLSVRRRSQSLNQWTDLVQIRYLGSSCKYLEPFFFYTFE